ncbi:MAG: hypothetical protein AAFW98_19100, partial [Pseudomonadota bacterium]
MAGQDFIVAAESRDVVVSDRTRWRHVIVTTRAGLTGAGEATLPHGEEGFHETLESALDTVIGRPLDRTLLSPLAHLPGEGLARATVYSALDQAATDLLAQQEGLPVAAFLSAAPAPEVELYANINRASADR